MSITHLIKAMTAGGILALFPTVSTLQAGPPDSSAIHLSGKLNQAGTPVNGEHEFRFQLFTTETGTTVVPKTQIIVTSETVAAGSWQTALDLRRFGGEKSVLDDTFFSPAQAVSILDNTLTPSVGDRAVLDDQIRTAMQQSWRAVEGNWLQISVRRKGTSTFVPLLPRQKLGSVPRASTAFSSEHATVAGSVSEGGVDNRSIAPGAITADKLAPVSISREALADLAVNGTKIAPETVVRSFNGLHDDVTLAAGAGVSLSAVGHTLTINSTATTGGGTPQPNGNFLGVDNGNQFASSATFGVMGGGLANQISGDTDYSILGGGQLNRINERSSWSFLGGGYFQQVGPDAAYASLGGGYANLITNANHATISGGNRNVAGGTLATIGGGGYNFAGPDATVAGGNGNQAVGEHSVISGGTGNSALAYQSVIGGGGNNVVETSINGTIGGGAGNQLLNSAHGTVGGGEDNRALNAFGAVVAGGLGNVAASPISAILGGEGNRTDGAQGYAMVLGGSLNLASGTHSLAAGTRANATHHGSFVWNAWPGRSDSTPFVSERDGEFAARAYGGFRFVTAGVDLGLGDITLDAGNAGLQISGKRANVNLSQSFNVSAGGVNFITGGQGLFVDGQRFSAGGGGLTDSSVTTVKLADGAVTVPKLGVTGTAANGKVLGYSGGNLAWTDATGGGGSGNGWSLTGNAGTDPAAAFLGTTDAHPLNFRVNNTPALRIEQGTEAVSFETRSGQNTIFNPGVNTVYPPTLVGTTVAGGGISNGQLQGNTVGSSFSTVSGGRFNTAGNSGDSFSTEAFVGGGILNSALGGVSVVVGGNANYAGNYCAILGGVGNVSDASGSVIGGGNLNLINETRSELRNASHHSGILGGQWNRINNSFYSFIGGGRSNHIQQAADGAVIGGGRSNETWGVDSVIPGGRNNYAEGSASFAAGSEAQALHAGSFVWNDAGGGFFASRRDHEFAVRARGGVRLETGGAGLLVDGVPVGGNGGNGPINVITSGGQTQPQGRLEQTNPDDYVRLMLNTPRSFWTVGTGPNGWFGFYVPGQSPANTTGDNGVHRFIITANGEVGVGSQQPFAQFHVRGHGGFALPQARLTQENAQDSARLRLETGPKSWDIAASPDGSLRFFSGVDRVIMDANGGLSATVVNQTSDRNAKRGFKPVNVKEVLAKVAAMPISEWQFKNDSQGSRHVGPMAQDFHAAFGVGATETQIATVDADGVALAAIQGLHQESLEKDERIRELEQQVRRLDELVRKLAERQP